MTPYSHTNYHIPKAVYSSLRKSIISVVLVAFVTTSIRTPTYAQEAPTQLPWMPKPGVMVGLSPDFMPAHLKGIVVHPDNPFQFDFIIYKGDKALDGAQKTQEYTKLIKYFLASLAVPDENQWVNLSPYEKNRIIKEDFGKTEMGRDLLAQDYILKQITASLIYPQDKLGQKFWDEVYQRAYKQYGTTNIPVNTFNKVWIVPDDAEIYEKDNIAYIYKSHLKVMLEEDYMSLGKHSGIQGTAKEDTNKAHAIGSQVIREIVLPALEKEVNEGQNFAMLRQVFSGMILAAWYKLALKESLLGKIYADKAKVKGVDQNPQNNEAIYQQYLKAFKKGVFNYIKEDVDKYSKETIPRKYFSGGFIHFDKSALHRRSDAEANRAMIADYSSNGANIEVAAASVDPAMNSVMEMKPVVGFQEAITGINKEIVALREFLLSSSPNQSEQEQNIIVDMRQSLKQLVIAIDKMRKDNPSLEPKISEFRDSLVLINGTMIPLIDQFNQQPSLEILNKIDALHKELSAKVKAGMDILRNNGRENNSLDSDKAQINASDLFPKLTKDQEMRIADVLASRINSRLPEEPVDFSMVADLKNAVNQIRNMTEDQIEKILSQIPGATGEAKQALRDVITEIKKLNDSDLERELSKVSGKDFKEKIEAVSKIIGENSDLVNDSERERRLSLLAAAKLTLGLTYYLTHVVVNVTLIGTIALVGYSVWGVLFMKWLYLFSKKSPDRAMSTFDNVNGSLNGLNEDLLAALNNYWVTGDSRELSNVALIEAQKDKRTASEDGSGRVGFLKRFMDWFKRRGSDAAMVNSVDQVRNIMIQLNNWRQKRSDAEMAVNKIDYTKRVTQTPADMPEVQALQRVKDQEATYIEELAEAMRALILWRKGAKFKDSDKVELKVSYERTDFNSIPNRKYEETTAYEIGTTELDQGNPLAGFLEAERSRSYFEYLKYGSPTLSLWVNGQKMDAAMNSQRSEHAEALIVAQRLAAENFGREFSSQSSLKGQIDGLLFLEKQLEESIKERVRGLLETYNDSKGKIRLRVSGQSFQDNILYMHRAYFSVHEKIMKHQRLDLYQLKRYASESKQSLEEEFVSFVGYRDPNPGEVSLAARLIRINPGSGEVTLNENQNQVLLYKIKGGLLGALLSKEKIEDLKAKGAVEGGSILRLPKAVIEKLPEGIILKDLSGEFVTKAEALKYSASKKGDKPTDYGIDLSARENEFPEGELTMLKERYGDGLDFAMTEKSLVDQAEVAKGGIDLNAANLNLKIKRDGNGVPLPVSQQDLENIQLEGLIPVILNIRPVTSLPMFAQLQETSKIS